MESSYIVVLSRSRNFLVYDTVLKTQLKTSYKDTCREFDMASVIAETEDHLMIVTHNAGETCLHLCTV